MIIVHRPVLHTLLYSWDNLGIYLWHFMPGPNVEPMRGLCIHFMSEPSMEPMPGSEINFSLGQT